MQLFINQQLNRYQVSLPQRTRQDFFLVPLYYYSGESCFPAKIFNHAGHRRDGGLDRERDKQSDLVVDDHGLSSGRLRRHTRQHEH